MLASGQVKDIFNKTVTSPKTGKSFKVWMVELADGSVYENGFNRPGYAIGDTVSFEWETKYGKPTILSTRASGNGGYNPASYPRRDSGADVPENTGSGLPKHYFVAKGYANLEKSFPVPVDHPDTAIIRQNALTNAREFIMTIQHELPSLSTDEIAELIIEYAYKFSEFTTGQREVKLANKVVADSE